MRVAIVELSSAAVRSVVAETTVGGHRCVLDRTVGVGLSHVLGGAADDPTVAGTVDIVHETTRRFREVHRRLGVLTVAVHVDEAIATDPVLGPLVDTAITTMGGARLPDTPIHEVRALARAVVARDVVDDRPVLLVELDRTTLRAAVLERGRVTTAHRVLVHDLHELGILTRSGGPDAWLEVALAAVTPLLAELPLHAFGERPRVMVAGEPARALGRVVASQRWRRPLPVADRVSVAAHDVMAVAAVGGDVPDAQSAHAGSDLPVATGAAVVVVGLLAGTGAAAAEVTDADRTEGHLLDLLGPAGRRSLATRVLEVAGDPTAHAQQVARLAVQLFDGLAPSLALDDSDRDVLEVAALVHDIARADGPGHHRRGGERVLGLPVRGVPPATLVEVASLVRSQRGRPPGSHVPAFLRLPPPRRRVVEQLVALLRLAIGLDEGAEGCVSRLRVRVEDHPGPGGAAHLPLVCVDVLGRDLDLVLYGARGQARYAEQVLEVRLVVRAAGRPLPAPVSGA